MNSSSWSASSVICQFPIPPTSTPSYVAAPQPSTSYAAPTVISLGEEYTDATLPQSSPSRGPSSSYLDFDEDEDEEDDGMRMMIDDDGDSDDEDSSDDESEDEDESDSEDYPVPHTPSSFTSASHNRYSRRRSQEQHKQQQHNQTLPALWHAEHARLLHIHTAVLDSEREARHRELKLESEVARIKNDLAKLKQSRANNNNTTTTTTNNNATTTTTTTATTTNNTMTTSPTSVQPSALGSRTFGPRGPRPRPIFQSPSLPHYTLTTSPISSSFEMEVSATETTTNPAAAVAAVGGFRDEEEEDEATAALLSNHLSEARSARAQERMKRRKENERIRELSMLLTLGSEVRKWEERLAWTNRARAASSPSSDDLHLSSGVNERKRKNEDDDMDPDPRAKRLSRSASLPSRAFNGTIHKGNNDNNNNIVQHQQQQQHQHQQQHRSGPPSPALPSLALSPLWRVSAEMILRRRSLSERPRRTPNQILSARSGFVSSPVSRAVTTAPAAVAPVQSASGRLSDDDVPTSSTSSTSIIATTATSTTTTATTLPYTLSRPAQTVRGPRERSTQIASTTATGTASNGRTFGSVSPKSLTRKAHDNNRNKVEEVDDNNGDNQDDKVSLTRDGTTSVATSALGPSSSPPSGKRYSIPPPITIPPADSFCPNTTAVSGRMTTTGGGVCSGSSKSESPRTFAAQQQQKALPATTTSSSSLSSSYHYSALSKSAPARPSALKWAFTADDLERESESGKGASQESMEMEIDEGAQSPAASCASSSSSSEESGSEAGSSSSSVSSSSASSGSSSSSSTSTDSQDGEAAVERRGRARFSWRKSLPKEKDANGEGNVTATTATATAMVATYDDA